MRKVLFLVVLLAGCASAPPAPESFTSPGVDLTAYRSFGWKVPAGSATAEAPLRIIDTHIRTAISAELTRRGYTEAATAPELLVDYETLTEDKLRSSPVRLGIGMGSGLYEAAFATVVRLWRYESRNAITGITLIAGFASTVAWPLSAWLNAEFGWRMACFAWAALHLGVALPLHMRVPRPPADDGPAAHSDTQAPAAPPAAGDLLPTNPTVTAAVLGYVFAVTWFI
ncbi:MAG: hypothetical protein J0M16_11585, partial [Gammaproteobacteria bacterium]|nr:hypothetical protein [Gammaproteobacteria bacterium]